MEQIKKVIFLTSWIFLIGFKTYAQSDSTKIIVGITHFTAPNYMLNEWRNLQIANDYLRKDNNLLETDRKVLLQDKANMIVNMTNQNVKHNKQIRNRNRLIKLGTIVIAIETVLVYILIKN